MCHWEIACRKNNRATLWWSVSLPLFSKGHSLSFLRRPCGLVSLSLNGIYLFSPRNLIALSSQMCGNPESWVFPSILAGQPRPPRFTSKEIGYRAHTYNVTWVTDSLVDAPITEYTLRFRRSDVSWKISIVRFTKKHKAPFPRRKQRR